MWTSRIMLEAKLHPVNSFWTFTYSDDNMLHTTKGLATLVPDHLTLFIKRLRFAYQQRDGALLRFYAVGEYGDDSGRPHYHAALFNFPSCVRGVTQPRRDGVCCEVCSWVGKLWGKGNVFAGQLEDASASYLAGYVTKKYTKADHPWLEGRAPEFARQSNKPGIGKDFIPEVASTLLEFDLDKTLDDVPTALRHGSKIRPLGRYLTRALREQIGRDPSAPESVLQRKEVEMLPLREAARKAPKGTYQDALKTLVLEVDQGKVAQLEAREKIHKKRGSI
jgi:hypothetical protein